MLLEGMIPRRMVRVDTLALESGVKGLGKVEAKPGESKAEIETVKKYRINPFLVGWYESYLTEDRPGSTEFARTYEQYVIEGGGEKVFCPRPGPQGVIPSARLAQAQNHRSASPTTTSTRTSSATTASS